MSQSLETFVALSLPDLISACTRRTETPSAAAAWVVFSQVLLSLDVGIVCSFPKIYMLTRLTQNNDTIIRRPDACLCLISTQRHRLVDSLRHPSHARVVPTRVSPGISIPYWSAKLSESYRAAILAKLY